jgi:hypothetical integral membrane protein (TIGR02206 family)
VTVTFSPTFSAEPFRFLSAQHLWALTVLLVVLAVTINIFHDRRSCQMLNRARVGLGVTIIFIELSWHAWALSVGVWHLNYALPLHLCSMAALLAIVMLFARSRPLFELLYFWAFAGTTQALLTPDLRGFNFPHFHYFWYFISHGLVILAVVWMMCVERLRPSWRACWRAALITNLYAGAVYLLNLITGGNYLLLMQKPVVPTMADWLGAWPGYLLGLELFGLALFAACYAPFALADWRRAKQFIQMG